MSELATEHCKDGAEVLAAEESNALAAQVPRWQRSDTGVLSREFEFANFRDAFGFVARAALVAEREFHHPDIELGWGRAGFKLTTHSAGGLTRNDFVMAAKIDALVGSG